MNTYSNFTLTRNLKHKSGLKKIHKNENYFFLMKDLFALKYFILADNKKYLILSISNCH